MSEKLCNIVPIAFNKKFNMLQLTGDFMFQKSSVLPAARSSNIEAIIVPSSHIVLVVPDLLFLFGVICFCHQFAGGCDWVHS